MSLFVANTMMYSVRRELSCHAIDVGTMPITECFNMVCVVHLDKLGLGVSWRYLKHFQVANKWATQRVTRPQHAHTNKLRSANLQTVRGSALLISKQLNSNDLSQLTNGSRVDILAYYIHTTEICGLTSSLFSKI